METKVSTKTKTQMKKARPMELRESKKIQIILTMTKVMAKQLNVKKNMTITRMTRIAMKTIIAETVAVRNMMITTKTMTTMMVMMIKLKKITAMMTIMVTKTEGSKMRM